MILRNNEGFTTEQCIHRILNTSKMSLAAKGLIIYLLTCKEDEYQLNIHDLCLAHCCRQSYLEKAIDELQEFGYIDYKLIKRNNGIVDGQFTIYDMPHEITMMRYEYKSDFLKRLTAAEKTFINNYLTVGRHKKRIEKISSLLLEMQNQVVDWNNIAQYIQMELTYEEFLLTEYWLIISQYMKIKSNFTCTDCGKKFKIFSQLNVHHKSYERHGWEHLEEVQNEDLVVCCESCHKKRHEILNELNEND